MSCCHLLYPQGCLKWGLGRIRKAGAACTGRVCRDESAPYMRSRPGLRTAAELAGRRPSGTCMHRLAGRTLGMVWPGTAAGRVLLVSTLLCPFRIKVPSFIAGSRPPSAPFHCQGAPAWPLDTPHRDRASSPRAGHRGGPRESHSSAAPAAAECTTAMSCNIRLCFRLIPIPTNSIS